MQLRLHLADNHVMVRESLARILAKREGIKVVGNSLTGQDAIVQVTETKPDIIVTQLDEDPRIAGEILDGLRAASPKSRIVVLTMWDNARYLRAIARMGIDALTHKSSTAEELVDVVETASLRPRGGRDVVVSLPRDRLERMDGTNGGLTDRQMEVLVLAARGLSNRDIGERLYIAEATVKRHLLNVYEALGVRTRNEAVRKALVDEWIGLHEIASEDAPGSPNDHADCAG